MCVDLVITGTLNHTEESIKGFSGLYMAQINYIALLHGCFSRFSKYFGLNIQLAANSYFLNYIKYSSINPSSTHSGYCSILFSPLPIRAIVVCVGKRTLANKVATH